MVTADLRSSTTSPRVFAQHVPKTAGTSLYHFLEPNYPYVDILTTQRIWQGWSVSPEFTQRRRATRNPFLACTPPSRLASLRYIHGHFRDLFRQVHCRDWFTIGTCREVNERTHSMLNHALRDESMNMTVVDYLLGNHVDRNRGIAALAESGHLGYFASMAPREIGWLFSIDDGKAIEQLATEARGNIAQYAYIIDSSRLDEHRDHLSPLFRHSANKVRVNTRESFGQRAEVSREDIERLRSDFPEYFALEEECVNLLRKKAETSLETDIHEIMDRCCERQKRTILVLPDCADVSDMGPAVPAGMDCWDSEYYRCISPDSRLMNLGFHRGGYTGYAWFWCADPERHRALEISLSTGDRLDSRCLFVEHPSQHLWLVQLDFFLDRNCTLNLQFKEPDSDKPACWLGAKFYWHDDATG